MPMRPNYPGKRLLDLTLAWTALVAATPILLAAAAAIRLDTPGPILFRQTRLGRHGRPFQILKLRTMAHAPGGPLITASGDRRVTRVGAFLRRTRIDELPQLWNVLRGDMSLVGPRPEVERFTRLFADDYAELLQVRPGLTDEATLAYRDEARLLAGAPDPEAAYVAEILPRKLALSRDGLRRSSLGHDLALMARTARSLVRP